MFLRTMFKFTKVACFSRSMQPYLEKSTVFVFHVVFVVLLVICLIPLQNFLPQDYTIPLWVQLPLTRVYILKKDFMMQIKAAQSHLLDWIHIAESILYPLKRHIKSKVLIKIYCKKNATRNQKYAPTPDLMFSQKKRIALVKMALFSKSIFWGKSLSKGKIFR